MQYAIFFGSLLAAVASGCGETNDEAGTTEGASTEAPPKKDRLDPVDEDGLYHWSEGSEFLPYFALRAMKVLERDAQGNFTGSETDDWLLSDKNLSRYGFIPDHRDASRRVGVPNDSMPDGADSLPIGMTLARAPDTGLASVGVNCAACHVGQIRLPDGQLRVVEGVPNMLEVGRFFGEAVQTLAYLAKDAPAELKAKYGVRLAKEAARTKIVLAGLEDEMLGTRDGTFDQIEALWKLVGERKTFDELIDGLEVPEERKALLRARKTFFDGLFARIELGKASTAQGFGRTDAFGTAKNMIFFGQGFMRETHAPVSFPSMLNMETIDLFHYNANTNSVLQRNIGQSIGLGAVFAAAKRADGTSAIVTSSNLKNLLRLEHSIYKLAPPKWPGRRDEQAAGRGEAVYRKACRSCHEPKPLPNGLYQSARVPIAEVGTDASHVLELGEHIVPQKGPGAGKDLGHLFSLTRPVFDGVEIWFRQSHPGALEAEEQAYAGSSVAAAKIAAARKEPWWRTTDDEADRQYVARPLDGVWATAPFLHNASVPTLAELLLPAAKRAKKFCVGHRDYDLRDVGYTVVVPEGGECPAGEVLFDTDTSNPSNRGNGNGGHEYGTDLPEQDKRDLIEFLKGFGAGQARPVVLKK